jgi:adenosine deaminase
MTTSTTRRPLLRLPKAHLHVHLEGAMRFTTLRELSDRCGVPVGRPGGPFGTFAAFQQLYLAARGVLRSLDDLARLVEEVVEDAAADGAIWIEISVNPQEHRHLAPPDVVLSALIAAGASASAVNRVGVGWLITADRTCSVDLAMEQALLATRFAGDGVVSFGLANDEAAAPPEPFRQAFAVARSAGLLSAPHGGEHRGPESVQGAVGALGAHRVQHGVRAIEDSTLVARLADHGICLDVCPTSNVLLSVVSDLESHPLPHLLSAGVACSINADDPLLFGVGLLDEYELCRSHLGLDDAVLAGCARSSIEHSGAPERVKSQGIDGIALWLRDELENGNTT